MEETSFHGAKFLIIDDQEYNVQLLERILKRKGYEHLITTTSPLQAIPLFHEHKPDIILLDLHMPELDGFQLLEQFRELIPKTTFLPILVLTADITPEAKKTALSAGAKDFLTKPLDRTEVLLRIQNLLETRFLHLQLQNQNQILEEKVTERTKDLELAQIEILECLAVASEFRDDVTGEHTRRVGEMSAKLALKIGLPESEAEITIKAAPLHDIGKIGIPDDILLKPGKFSDDEYEHMKQHTLIGKDIVSRSRFPILKMAQDIAQSHHEKWDGTGYPNGLRGEDISLAGRIVAVVDFFDALTHERPYKKAWTIEQTIEEIERQKEKHFDPVVAENFIQLVKQGDVIL